MKNQATWDQANKFSCALGVVLTIVLIAVFHLFNMNYSDTEKLTAIALLTMLGIVILSTEIWLRKKFDKEGRPKK